MTWLVYRASTRIVSCFSNCRGDLHLLGYIWTRKKTSNWSFNSKAFSTLRMSDTWLKSFKKQRAVKIMGEGKKQNNNNKKCEHCDCWHLSSFNKHVGFPLLQIITGLKVNILLSYEEIMGLMLPVPSWDSGTWCLNYFCDYCWYQQT